MSDPNLVAASPAVLAAGFFPGPRSENEPIVRGEIDAVLDHWFRWRGAVAAGDPDLGPTEGPLLRVEQARLSAQALELCERLTAELPTHTPHYIGHMKAELSLPALIGWFAATLHNPNNTSRESSRVGVEIESEAIGMLARMVGYDPSLAQGHFTSGGTLANFEGVWRARYRLDHWLSLALLVAERTGEALDVFASAHMGWDRFEELLQAHNVTEAELRACSAVAGNPADVYRRISAASATPYMGPVVLVPGNKHYSWQKAANVFGLGEEAFWSVGLDDEGRLDLADFEQRVLAAPEHARPILMAVSVAGTTEAGEIDPIDQLHALLAAWHVSRGWRIWSHVDAAYGGFLCSLLGAGGEAVLGERSRRALESLREADSITLDPHKLGYVPYACGAFLVRDRTRYAVSAFTAPYLDRPELGDGKWSSTLEGSRSAAGAAATWLTGRTIGFGGERFGAVLAETVSSRREVGEALAAIDGLRVLDPADSNILCFALAGDAEPSSLSNLRTERLFRQLGSASGFVVSRTTLGPDYRRLCERHVGRYGGVHDAAGLLMIRCVFMNPYWGAPRVREALIPELAAAVRAISQGASLPAPATPRSEPESRRPAMPGLPRAVFM
jgi:glutamate/tyrosine decarboxylase-like PLP-dependent enzyme